MDLKPHTGKMPLETQLSVLYEISSIPTSVSSLSELSKTVLDKLTRVLGIPLALLYLHDKESGDMVFWDGKGIRKADVPGRIHECKEIDSNILSLIPPPYKVTGGVCLPVLKRNTPLALILIFRKEELSFSDTEMNLLNILVDKTGAALETYNLISELRNKSDKLKKSNKELEQFAAIASHDLRGPLGSIQKYLEYLLDNGENSLDDTTVEFMTHAVKTSERMMNLVDGLLSYSKMGSKSDHMKIDCGNVLLDIQQSLFFMIRERNAVIIIDRNLPVITGNEFQMYQLFQNLVSNALKYNDSNTPEIRITAEKQGSYWLFAVKDNGIGIHSEDLQTIFNIFRQLKTGRTEGGIGLGLAVCKKIVENHGGRIWVESVYGKGSVFHFTLPLNEC